MRGDSSSITTKWSGFDMRGNALCRTWDNVHLARVSGGAEDAGPGSGCVPYELDVLGQVFSVGGSCHVQDQVQLDDLYDLTCSKLECYDLLISLNSEFYHLINTI